MVRSGKKPWVPAPALTSPVKRNNECTKKQGSKSDGAKLTNDTVVSRNPRGYYGRLEDLLSEIREIKSNLSKPFDLQNDRLQVDHETDESKPVFQREGPLLQQSLNDIKVELPRNISDNDMLVKRHLLLVKKLKRVEVDAVDAVHHVVALREFIQKLNQDGISNIVDSPREREKRQEMLAKLSRLDEANKSLQSLLLGVSVGNENEPWKTTDKNDGRRLDESKLVAEMKTLQEQLQSDHKEILRLRTALMEAALKSEKSNEALKNEISIHREAANKYLSVIDGLKLQFNEKNEEINKLKVEVNSLKLRNTQLYNENTPLRLQNSDLKSKLSAVEMSLKGEEANLQAQVNELTFKFSAMSSKATILEVENGKLKLTLGGMQDMVSRQKSEIERLTKELLQTESMKSALSSTNIDRTDKFVQVNLPLKKSDSVSNILDVVNRVEENEGNKCIKVVELWQIVQNEKSAIMQQLKDLEIKLEKSEVANLEFRRELNKKEDSLKENDLKLQEKILESNSLKEMLEAALKDLKKFGEEAKKSSVSLDHVTQTKLNELEKMAQHYRNEYELAKRQKDQLEQKLIGQIHELEGRLETFEKTNRNMQDYITFLRTSYANVFGAGSLATTSYPF